MELTAEIIKGTTYIVETHKGKLVDSHSYWLIDEAVKMFGKRKVEDALQRNT